MRTDTWWDETTVDGDHIWIDRDPYVNPRGRVSIKINQEPVRIVGRVSRLRDGGTTLIPTNKGRITCPSLLTRRIKEAGRVQLDRKYHLKAHERF